MTDEEKIAMCRYNQQFIGKYINSSKIKHIWEFTFEDKYHTVILTESKYTNKRKLSIDGCTLIENKMYIFTNLALTVYFLTPMKLMV
jgi:hypothetical protein